MHAQKWPLFLPKTQEENPLFRVRELSIISVGTTNNIRIWGKNCVISSSIVTFCHFLYHQVSTSNGAKGKFVAKT